MQNQTICVMQQQNVQQRERSREYNYNPAFIMGGHNHKPKKSVQLQPRSMVRENSLMTTSSSLD